MRILSLVALTGLLSPLMLWDVGSSPLRLEESQEEPQEELPPERTNLKRLVANCKKCHADVHAEWSETQHAKSWTDPVFQAEIAQLPDKGASCARCHAPRSLWHKEMGEIPAGREKDRELGVNCVTCHMLGNVYFGPFDSQGHGGVEGEHVFRESKMCFSCHGQPEARKEHDQMTSYLAGPAWTKDGKSCQTCHMPLVERKLVTKKSLKMKFLIGVQPVRMHNFTGARRGEIVAGCADVVLTFEADKLVARVTTNTGHSLPCTTHRRVVLEVRQYGQDDAELAEARQTFRFPDGPTLMPGDPNAFEWPIAAGAVKARASLVQVLEKTGGRPEDVVQPIDEAETTR